MSKSSPMSEELVGSAKKAESPKKESPLLQLAGYVMKMRSEEREYFLGRVLTIIDAAVPNDRQNKNLKDVIREAFYMDNWHWSDLVPMLERFKDKYIPEIEKDCLLSLWKAFDGQPYFNRSAHRGAKWFED